MIYRHNPKHYGAAQVNPQVAGIGLLIGLSLMAALAWAIVMDMEKKKKA